MAQDERDVNANYRRELDKLNMNSKVRQPTLQTPELFTTISTVSSSLCLKQPIINFLTMLAGDYAPSPHLARVVVTAIVDKIKVRLALYRLHSAPRHVDGNSEPAWQ
jgi:hypothetical protein